ncbi:DUF1996 domain-containing protein [Streptomyces sp. NPDC046862]|uniref:DUF1996 domain-containing protein n=1 Tax=Streptomyces sp. NPDC046862 TaxID=3154603 RepID=UPI003452CC60
MLGGGGLVVANVYASATESHGVSQRTAQSTAGRAAASGAATIDCPDVGSQLTAVPDQARPEVDRELALLDKQVAEAYQRLQGTVRAQLQDSGFTDSAIMNPLKEKRAATIERILIAVDRVGDRPQGLEAFAPCTFRASGNQGRPEDGQNGDQGDAGRQDDGGDQGGQDQNQDEGQGQGEGQGNDNADQSGNGGQAGNGPVAADFVDITTVQPNVQKPRPRSGASRGTFTTDCGVNAGGLFNSDNVIVAPGVSNGAHHFHDYVGNQANNAFASDEDLTKGRTSCEAEGDKSSYFWPVLRLQNGTREQDADSPGGGIEGNAGEIVTPKQVTMTFVGNPAGKVTEMPRLLRIITGDAKAFVNGTANANASWSCTGFENKVQLKDKYPVCPRGSDVVRTFRFQSCWDGRNIDSANHRTHVAFADADGTCANGFRAIPQLVQRIVYDVDAPSLDDGGRTTPLFAVDSFPEQLHKPVTDHGDFINVFDEDLMREMVDCVNSGQKCDAASGAAGNPEPGTGGEDASGGQTLAPATNKPAPEQDDDQTEQAEQPADEDADNGAGKGRDSGSAEPRTYALPSATHREQTPSTADPGGATPGPEPTTGYTDQSGGSGTAPQAITGDLADTGARLWPAAIGGVLLLVGSVLLRRIRRRTW